MRLRVVGRIARHMPGFALGITLIVGLSAYSLLLPLLPHGDPTATNLLNPLQPPSAAHWFGTDDLGRDVLLRILFGLRASWFAALVVILIAAVIGTPIGLIASWFGGIVDRLLMGIVDVFLAFPVIIFALAIAAMLGPSIPHAVIALSAVWWTWYSRIARSEGLVTRTRGHVEAAWAMGVPSWRILQRHVLPEVLRPVAVLAALDVGTVVLVLAALSFLGAGAQPPTPELGLMVASGLPVIFSSWWVPIFPAIAVSVLAIAANLFATGLRDLSNIQLRRDLTATDEKPAVLPAELEELAW